MAEDKDEIERDSAAQPSDEGQGSAGDGGTNVVNGAGNEPRCMRMEENDGDVAIDLLGALATKMPAAPTRDGLIALCTAAP